MKREKHSVLLGKESSSLFRFESFFLKVCILSNEKREK